MYLLALLVGSENSLLGIVAKGGILMAVLLLISIIAIAIIIERMIKLNRASKLKDEFIQNLYEDIAAERLEKAVQKCENKKSAALSGVLAKIIDNFQKQVFNDKEALEMGINNQIHMLERNLGALSTFAAIAPLIGFLGTVTGMVKVFMKIGETGGGVDISLLANGIWEALLTTVGGLTVGIITILFYNYLVSKLEVIEQNLEEEAHNFLATAKKLRSQDEEKSS
ncbi:MAG: MotA/TolQ/ExbB proton channel family protein [Candidatus Cloacimonadota bacterium]|nr:MotA/TolQ/ExbB proton channel family protein [Candidatus Cloacimonadota bacterium]